MSQCVSCSNQPNTNDSLGGAAHEGTVTPTVIGIIVGTIIVFIIVVCALFYCVKLENRRFMAKVEEEEEEEEGESESPTPGGSGGDVDDSRAGQQQQQQQLERSSDHVHGIRAVSSREMSIKSRSSSSVTQVVVEPQSCFEDQAVREVAHAAGGGGKKRLVFGWGKKGRSSGECHISYQTGPNF